MRHQDELLDSLRELLFKLHSGIRSKLKVRRGDKLIKNHGKQNEKGFCLRLCKILQKMVWFFFFVISLTNTMVILWLYLI